MWRTGGGDHTNVNIFTLTKHLKVGCPRLCRRDYVVKLDIDGQSVVGRARRQGHHPRGATRRLTASGEGAGIAQLTRGTVTSSMRRAAHPSGCARCGAGADYSSSKFQALSLLQNPHLCKGDVAQISDFYSILLYSILFHSILFYSISFYSTLFHSTLLLRLILKPLPNCLFQYRKKSGSISKKARNLSEVGAVAARVLPRVPH